MNNKYLMFIVIGGFLITAGCNINDITPDNKQADLTKNDSLTISLVHNPKGVGRFSNVKLTNPLDNDMAANGEAISSAECATCHKLTDEQLIGPGWKGITERRTPEWIMNFITNTQMTMDKNHGAQSEIVTCVIRMPRQYITDEQAREVLEFMRKNDGKI